MGRTASPGWFRAPCHGRAGLSRLAALALTGALILGPALALAQPPEEPGGEDGPPEGGDTLQAPAAYAREDAVRVAVLILAARGVDPEIADSLTEVVIGSVASRGGAAIVGKEEFQAQLGQGEARSMECVSSIACLGRVGVQLAVDEVIAGTVGRRGQAWIFNINRIDIRTGELVGRAFRELRGDLGDVAAAIQEAVPSLYEGVRRPATLLVQVNVEGAEVTVDGMLVGVFRGETVVIPDMTPGRHELVVSAPGHFEWQRAVNVAEGTSLQIEVNLEAVSPTEDEGGVSPVFWLGLGVGVAAGASAVTFGMLSRRDDVDGLTRVDAIDYMDARRREARIANASMGIAAAGVATAVVGLVLSDFGSSERPVARLGVAPQAGGAIVQIEGAL